MDAEVDDDYTEEDAQEYKAPPMEPSSASQIALSDKQNAAYVNDILAYAQNNGLDAGALIVAIGNMLNSWQSPENRLGVMQRYNDTASPDKQWQLPLKAPVVRGKVCACYCLHCKQTVRAVGVRMTGNRCIGKCTRCGRSVSSFVAVRKAGTQTKKVTSKTIASKKVKYY
jgi:hypothetical protein